MDNPHPHSNPPASSSNAHSNHHVGVPGHAGGNAPQHGVPHGQGAPRPSNSETVPSNRSAHQTGLSLSQPFLGTQGQGIQMSSAGGIKHGVAPQPSQHLVRGPATMQTGSLHSVNYATPSMSYTAPAQQMNSWSVPNPLGLGGTPQGGQSQSSSSGMAGNSAGHYQNTNHRAQLSNSLNQGRSQLHQSSQGRQTPSVPNLHVQQNQHQHQQAMASKKPKPKVVLSQEAKQALAKAIWSAIRSPVGQVDPELMQAALKTGLPKHAILNAARVARDREALKRKGLSTTAPSTIASRSSQIAQATNTSTGMSRQLSSVPSSVASVAKPAPQPPNNSGSQRLPMVPKLSMQQQALLQQQQQEKARQQRLREQQQLQQQQKVQEQKLQEQQRQQQKANKAVESKILDRSRWKRAHSGLFMVQKGRFLAVPFSVGAMVRSEQTAPVVNGSTRLVRPVRDVVDKAAILQKMLRERKATGLPSQRHLEVEPPALLDPDKFKRVKIEPKKYAKGLDRAVRKYRQQAAEALTKQHKELNKAMSSHHQEFFKFHRQRRADITKIAKVIRDSFDKEEKKKEKDAVQAERARLAALRANDMTAYSQLLEETKNDRLKYLLEKTEKHFTHISSLLQKRSEGDGKAAASGPSSYYATAHNKTEEVRQPSILVGGDLKEYQLTGLQWMVSLYNNKLNGILADEMGLGKTVQAISLIAYLMEYKQNLGPFLVIVPLSTLSNWQNEFAKWCPAARMICYKGTPTQRRDLFKDQVRNGHFNVLLTTYEYIIKDKNMLRKIIWQYAIVDEGHRMKNAQSKFAVTIGTQYSTHYRILLTGTPLMNDLSELWSLLNFLLPAIFNSVDTFDQWFSRPFAQFGGSNNEEEGDPLLSNEERILIIHRLHELLRPFMLRRVKSEVLDQLPEKVEKVVRCELSSWQKELYKQISAKAVADPGLAGSDQQVPLRGLNNVVMQLRKVCNHPYLFSPEGYHVNDRIIRSSGKLALLDQMLPKFKAAGHRVLMFTQMTAVMTILEDYFMYRGYRSLRLDGSTPAEEREKRMYKFNSQDSPYFIFLLSTRAGGLGLNLTAADTVIIFDSDWNPMMDLQAQDRAHRIGQRSNVSVFRLVTYSPVEEKILSRATEKLNVSELVVESGQFNKQSVDSDNSLERKKMMEVLLTDFDTTAANAKPSKEKETTPSKEKEGSDDENGDDGSEDSDKEDLNEMLSNTEADYELYTKLDKTLDQVRTPAPLFTSPDDVPEWIRNPKKYGAAAGSGAFTTSETDVVRKRKNVMYDDGLTEKQFLRMMEKQADEEEQPARKKARTSKGAAPKATTPSVAEPVEQLSSDVSGPSLLTDWTFRKLISCTKSVVDLKEPSTKRRVAEIFLEKPDPATFPDYYELIERPIAINDILRKCRGKLYTNIPEFRADWKLMFANARQFNGDDSWVVVDAVALEKELERVLKKNGFTDDHRPPTSKKKKLRIKLSLKDIKKEDSS